jgi:hypothetical protein
MNSMDADELNAHIEREIRTLQREFAGSVPDDEVREAVRAQLEQLRATAAFDDFIPLLVYRRARDVLLESARGELHLSA